MKELIMDDKTFNELLNSTKEARQILGKKATSSRTFYIDESDGRWQKIRSRYTKCYSRLLQEIQRYS